MTIEVIINGTKHVERVEKRNMYVHDFFCHHHRRRDKEKRFTTIVSPFFFFFVSTIATRVFSILLTNAFVHR